MSTNLRLLRRVKGKFQSLRLYEHRTQGLVEAVDVEARVITLRRFPREMLSERLLYAAEVVRGIDLENVNKPKPAKRKRAGKLGARWTGGDAAGNELKPRRKAGGGS